MLLSIGKELHAYLRSRQEVLMKAFFKLALARLLALLFSVSVAFAQTNPPAPRNAVATPPELDQLLAPIALYPDSLLSQILMASTYPLEVVQAARWSRANPHLKGEEATNALEQRDWDLSVKALAAFPQVLAMMDQQLDWTARLGDVFIAQEPQVMETVQNLRHKAYAAGNLRSTEQAYVYWQGDALAIEPASPQVVYVPYYDPRVAYGRWWWPAYPPVYWAPWPGYYAYPGYVVGFSWGVGVIVGPGFFFGACDWRQRHVTVVNITNVTVNRQVIVNRWAPASTIPAVWQHDPVHRRGVPYPIGSLQQRFGGTTPHTHRRDFERQGPPAPASHNGSQNWREVHSANPRANALGTDVRSNPRRSDDERSGRWEGRNSFFANPAVARSVEARPEFRGPVRGAPAAPVAAPPGHASPSNVPHWQGPVPRPVAPATAGPMSQVHGFTDFSANPAVARRLEARPEFRGPVSGSPAAPVAAPPGHASPSNVPHWQGHAPQPVAPAPAAHMSQAYGFSDRGQAGNRPAPFPARAYGDGHRR
jgi:hypothetical protein